MTIQYHGAQVICLRCILLLALLGMCMAFLDKHHREHAGARCSSGATTNGCGDQVCITDYVMKNDAKGAKDATEVLGVFPDDTISYAGFALVNETAKNKLFFWYVPALNQNPDTPLLIWLQGGPGSSSLFGMFAEMGPFSVDDDGNAVARSVTWNRDYGMIFIDNPVGAGYSYTETSDGYCTDTKTQVSAQLYELMRQFYEVFPEEASNDLYITGESYAGHYVPGLAHYMMVQNQRIRSGETKGTMMPLAGVAIGDGWIDPYSHVSAYPAMLQNLGVVDYNERAIIADYCERTQARISEGDMTAAFELWDEMINGDVYPYPNYFHNVTGSNDYDNFMNTQSPPDLGNYYAFVTSDSTRRGIHVGDAIYGGVDNLCEMNLLGDFMVSLKPELEALMENVKVLIYSGQLDVIIGAALTDAMMPTLHWSHQEEFIKTKKVVWRVNAEDKEVAGYVKQYANLTHAIVRGAGHLVPYDQPERAMDMLNKWIKNIRFQNNVDPQTPDL